MPRTPNPKSAFNARIHAEKRWDEWVTFREQLKHVLVGKVKDQDIWQIASFNFKPLDGSPHEVTLTKRLEDLVRGTEAEAILYHQPPVIVPFDPDEPWLDGDLDAPAAVVVPSQPNVEFTGNLSSLGGIAPPQSIKAPPLPVDDTGWTVYARNIQNNATAAANNAAVRDQVWAKLAYAIDRSKQSSVIDNANWIYQNMGTPPELIRPEDVPSSGALAHLRDVQEDKTTRQDFLKSWMVKLIPDKKQMEYENRRNQGSAKVLQLLDDWQDEWEKQHAEPAAPVVVEAVA